MGYKGRIWVYVIDGGQGFLDDRPGWIDGLFTINELTVTSVEDMVTQIEKRAGKLLIQNLRIDGHGSPGFQAIGCGRGSDSSGLKSLQVDPATGKLLGTTDALLRRLALRFAQDALVTLGGCEVGRGPAGEALLKAVSACLRVPVQAGTATQLPLLPGMEGDVIRCSGSSCKNLGGGSWWASPGSLVQ